MARKTKEKTNNLKKQGTKDEKFNFDEEIIIGLKRIDEDKPKVDKKSNKGKKNKIKNNKKKIKQGATRKSKKINLEQSYVKKDKMLEAKQGTTKKVKANNIKQEKVKQDVVKNAKKTKKSAPKKQLTPKQELAKKKRKAVFRLVKWVTLLAIILGGIIYALLSPIFNIKTISVVGNSKISIDEIISLSGLQLEQNMFKYRKSEVENQIKENAYVDEVQVKRKIPDTVEIVISEREASYMIQFANAYAYINNQGYILEISDKKEKLPLITGIETMQENIQTGNRLCTADLKKLGDVLKIMESSVSNGLAEDITKIDITNSDNYVLTLQEKKKTVYLGDTSNLSTKMLWILKFNELEGNTQGEIILNMNLNDEKNKPYFRKKI